MLNQMEVDQPPALIILGHGQASNELFGNGALASTQKRSVPFQLTPLRLQRLQVLLEGAERLARKDGLTPANLLRFLLKNANTTATHTHRQTTCRPQSGESQDFFS